MLQIITRWFQDVRSLIKVEQKFGGSDHRRIAISRKRSQLHGGVTLDRPIVHQTIINENFDWLIQIQQCIVEQNPQTTG